jgi:hypothetical protein
MYDLDLRWRHAPKLLLGNLRELLGEFLEGLGHLFIACGEKIRGW